MGGAMPAALPRASRTLLALPARFCSCLPATAPARMIPFIAVCGQQERTKPLGQARYCVACGTQARCAARRDGWEQSHRRSGEGNGCRQPRAAPAASAALLAAAANSRIRRLAARLPLAPRRTARTCSRTPDASTCASSPSARRAGVVHDQRARCLDTRALLLVLHLISQIISCQHAHLSAPLRPGLPQFGEANRFYRCETCGAVYPE